MYCHKTKTKKIKMGHTSRAFTKYNKNRKQNIEAQKHHLARLYMMIQEEKGIFISYEQALKETK